MNVLEILDFSDPRLDVYARATENQLLSRENPEEALFIAESPKVIERALDAGFEPVSILTERRHISGESAPILERCGDVPIFTAEQEVLARLTGFKLTRGLLCAMRRRPLPSLEEVCAGTKRVAVLENVVNPTNIGAIFRSAAALNMDAVLLTPACADPLYRRATRVSMGTVFQIPWTYLGDNWHLELKEMGFKTVSMALKPDSLSIDDPALNAEERLAVILGTEGDGLADSTITESDFTVCIPMSHGVDSLNVAAASAVAFWQLGNK